MATAAATQDSDSDPSERRVRGAVDSYSYDSAAWVVFRLDHQITIQKASLIGAAHGETPGKAAADR